MIPGWQTELVIMNPFWRLTVLLVTTVAGTILLLTKQFETQLFYKLC